MIDVDGKALEDLKILKQNVVFDMAVSLIRGENIETSQLAVGFMDLAKEFIRKEQQQELQKIAIEFIEKEKLKTEAENVSE